MQALSSVGYPRNLSYVCRKLNGYSKATYKLQTIANTTASGGNVITFDLPSNSLVDTQSINMFFKGSTSAATGFCSFPKNIECCISRIETEINGQLISAGANNLEHLYSVLYDTTVGTDCKSRRSILQNAADQVVPAANTSGKQFCINNWLGFLGSVSPSIIDTSLLGNVRVRVTLASPNVLIQTAGATGANFTFSDIFISCDVIDIQDGVFHDIHNRYLQSAGVYEMPFNNYYGFSSAVAGSFNQSTKFSLSTQSLNHVWAFFALSAPYVIDAIAYVGDSSPVVSATPAAYNPITKTSSYFTRVAGGNAGTVISYGNASANTPVDYKLNDVQFNVNGMYYPNYRVTPEQSFGLLSTIQGSYDVLGGCDPNLNSMAAWLSSYFTSCVKFDHNSDGVSLISGIDTRGNISQAYWQTTSDAWTLNTNVGAGGVYPQNIMAYVFAQCSSSLMVGAGRQIELVL